MYKKIVVAVIIVLLSSSNVWSFDGNLWANQTKLEKAILITGISKGRMFGMYALLGMIGGFTKDDVGKACAGSADRIVEHWDNKYTKGVADRQIIEGIDRLYDDYRNKIIRIDDAYHIVLQEIAGDNRNFINETIKNAKEFAKNN